MVFNKLKELIKDQKAQGSLEFLIVLGIVVLAAIAVGFYLKQVSSKKAMQSNDLKEKSLDS